MLFTRRVLQQCLNRLDWLSESDVQALIRKLNDHGPARLPAVWEVVVLDALSHAGQLQYERAYHTGRKPDISFNSRSIAFAADITCVSDSGLDAANPVYELSEAIEKCKSQLGLPVGGLHLSVESERKRTKRGEKTTLLLPPKHQITKFVKDRVEPVFREQIAAGATVLDCVIDEPGIRFRARVQGERFSTTSYAGYDRAASLTQNPLFNALKSKARKLREIPNPKGVIACDGDSATLSPEAGFRNEFSVRKIAEEFLRQNSSMDFVLVISAKQESGGPLSRPGSPKLVYTLVTQPGLPEVTHLEAVFRKMAENMPPLRDMPVNAALRAREPGYGWGKHGASTMSGKSLKMSSRLMMEVLAGRRSVEELNRLQRWRLKTEPQDNATVFNPFERWLDEGRLPIEIHVDADPEGNDDMISFTVGDEDPAVSPFKLPASRRPWRKAAERFARSTKRWLWSMRG